MEIEAGPVRRALRFENWLKGRARRGGGVVGGAWRGVHGAVKCGVVWRRGCGVVMGRRLAGRPADPLQQHYEKHVALLWPRLRAVAFGSAFQRVQ